jgi:zinc transport system substrate-binding protein
MKLSRPLLALLLPLSVISCTKTAPTTGKIRVAVSILPLFDFVRQIGGEEVEAFSIVPPGSNPHTFELTPDVLRKTVSAKLLVLNGIGLEYWATKVTDNIRRDDFRVVNTSEGLSVLQDEDHAEGNPHVWLDPILAIHQVEKIGFALCAADTAHAAYYRKNMEALVQQLQDLDEEIRREVGTWRHRQFICFHPSWNYFANRYQLDQAAVIEKRPGFEPNPGEMAEIIETAKRIHARAIFAEMQFPVKISEAIAQESGAKVIRLDPLGSDEATFSYVGLMHYNLQQMSIALK